MASPAASTASFVSAEQLQNFHHQIHAPAAAGDHSLKGLHEHGVNRQIVSMYEPRNYFVEDVMLAVENCMKKHADNLLHSLDGIAGRLSQLEVHCYKLERSVGALRGNMIQDHNDTDLKLKLLEKQLQEVHKCLQILQDKQELAETKRELAKLQLLKDEADRKAEAGITSTIETKENEEKQAANHQISLMPLHQAPQMLTPAGPQLLHVQTNAPQTLVQQIQPFQEAALQHPANMSLGIHPDPYKMSVAKPYDLQVLSPEQDQQNQSRPQPAIIYVKPKAQSHDLPMLLPTVVPQLGAHVPNTSLLLQQHKTHQSFQQHQLHGQQSQPLTLQPSILYQASQPVTASVPVTVQDSPQYSSQQLHPMSLHCPEAFPISTSVHSPSSRNMHGVFRPDTTPLGHESLASAGLHLLRHQSMQSEAQVAYSHQGLSETKVGQTGSPMCMLQGNTQSYHHAMSCGPNFRISGIPRQFSTAISGHEHPYRESLDDQVGSAPQRMVAIGQPGDYSASP